MAVFDTFKCFIHKFFTIRNSTGWSKIDYVDMDQLTQAKNWNITLEKWTFSSLLVKWFSIFCLDELAQINIIYLSATSKVPDSDKFIDKAYKSIKYSHYEKVFILAIFIQSFNPTLYGLQDVRVFTGGAFQGHFVE